MYTVIKRDVVPCTESEEKAKYRVDIMTDTVADIPDPPPEQWTAGSTAIAVNSQVFKMLNNAREWVQWT